MKMTVISDTHGKHRDITDKLKGGDVLVHCGDYTGFDHLPPQDFQDWFEDLPYEYKLITSGNHDAHGEDLTNKDKKVYHLNNKSMMVEGKIFHGFPFTPVFRDWNWMLDETAMEMAVDLIPDMVDIVFSHGPPKGILDTANYRNEQIGCKYLSRRIREINPLMHVFGHCHEGYGITRETMLNGRHTAFYNVSCMDAKFKLNNEPLNCIL